MPEKDLIRPNRNAQTSSETEIEARGADREGAGSDASGTAGGSRYREFVDVDKTPAQEREEVRDFETRQATTK